MKMGKILRVGICEDEMVILEFIESVVQKWLLEKNIEHEIITALQGEILLAQEVVFDIVFLDITFANSKMDGIAIGKQLRERSKQTKIIYVTGYPDYQTDAMDVHFFYYLIKPVTKNKIARQLQEAIEYIEAVPVTLPFETEEGIVRINLDSIYYLYYFAHNRIRIFTEKGEHVVRDTMKNMSARLSEYPFFLVHQAYLVNLCQVKRPYAKKVTMLNGDELPVADRRSSVFRKAFYAQLYKMPEKKN